MFECGEIPLTVRVLHEDELLVVVDKPTGVGPAPGGGLDPTETLQAQVTAYIGSKAYLVHRLDRETSGVIVFAKSPEAHRELSRQFEERQVTKRYLALVDGHVDGDAGEITLPLREFGSGRVGVDHRAGRRAPAGRCVSGWRGPTCLRCQPNPVGGTRFEFTCTPSAIPSWATRATARSGRWAGPIG